MAIDNEIEAIFAGQDVDGDVDIDGVIAAFERLRSLSTKADLPILVAAIQSPRNNFWTRELLSEPICHLGGSDYLESLFEAAQLNLDERHDNDGFHSHLLDIAHAEPKKCRSKLNELLAQKDYPHQDYAKWLLSFCECDEPSGTT